MLRFLFSAGAVFVLVFSTCLLPQTASARRCPVKEPETLLSLFQNSDAIYVATFDKIVEGEVIEKNDDYTSVEIRKHFTISSTLKGQSRKFFVLEDRDYQYKSRALEVVPEEDAEEPDTAKPETETVVEEAEVEFEEEADTEELKNGDTLLLFLKKGEEGESLVLTDYRDGIKKMPSERIAVYEARINDLNSIFSAKKISEARILDWLIRCAEDPITRWEGTFELLRSVRNQKWREQAELRRKERIAAGLPVEEIGEPEMAVPESEAKESDEPKGVNTDVFAEMLDAGHKQTLANILLNFSSTKKAEANGGKAEYVPGDRELLQLVSEWSDPRLVGFLIDQVRAGSDDASDTAEKMEMVAAIVKNNKLSEIVRKYAEAAYQSDDDEVESESAEDQADVPEVEPDSETLPTEETESPLKEEVETSNDMKDVEKSDAKKLTYKELRADLLQKFLAAYDSANAERDSAKVAKSNR